MNKIYLKRVECETGYCHDINDNSCYFVSRRICKDIYDVLPCIEPQFIYRQVTPSEEVRRKYERL